MQFFIISFLNDSKFMMNSRITFFNTLYHECDGEIEKSVPKITVWHHKACRVTTNGDLEGQFFLSNPHTNNGFSLQTIKFTFKKNLPEVHDYLEL